jgi:16S rRNA U1498 N3-methylase RsmE
MQLPIFFIEKAAAVNEMLVLEEDTSKHVVQVLRMQRKELLQLTDGQRSSMQTRKNQLCVLRRPNFVRGRNAKPASPYHY